MKTDQIDSQNLDTLCLNQDSLNQFFILPNIKKIEIINCKFNTAFIPLHSFFCRDLMVLKPSEVYFYKKSDRSWLFQSAELMFVGKADTLLPILKGQSKKIFIAVYKPKNIFDKVEYFFPVLVDSSGIQKEFTLKYELVR